MYATAGNLEKTQAIKSDIGDILNSGQYYCNEEIARELTSINNGLEHIKLNNDLKNDDRGGPGSLSAVGNLAGYMNQYKAMMGTGNVLSKQENEIRMLNQLALTNLRNLENDLRPYAATAANDIREFGDKMGITDRFTSYRNNLTRIAREPDPTMWVDRPTYTRAYTTMGTPACNQTLYGREVMVPDYGVMGKKISFGTEASIPWALKGYRTVDSLYPRRLTRSVRSDMKQSAIMTDVRTMNALNDSCRPSSSSGRLDMHPTRNSTAYMMARSPCTLTAQDRASIPTKFPGQTEYRSRYLRPPLENFTSSFNINPTPNFAVGGRPLVQEHIEPKTTEFSSRYVWPDASRVAKDPWLRK